MTISLGEGGDWIGDGAGEDDVDVRGERETGDREERDERVAGDCTGERESGGDDGGEAEGTVSVRGL